MIVSKTRKVKKKNKLPTEKLFAPVGFNPADYLPPHLLKYGDCSVYLLHLIHEGYLFDKVCRESGYVPLMASLLRPYFSQEFEAIRDALIVSGAIECDKIYSPGSKSFGYRLGPKLRGCRFARYEIKLPALLKARAAWKTKDNTKARLTLPKRYVVKWTRMISIDVPGALAWIDANANDKNRDCLIHSVHTIDAGNWEPKVCKQGRLYTPICNLKSGLRQFLNFDGQPVVNNDIKNSQPVFLCLLVLMSKSIAGCLSSSVNVFGKEKLGYKSDAEFFNCLNALCSNEDLFKFFKEIEEKKQKEIEIPPYPYDELFDIENKVSKESVRSYEEKTDDKQGTNGYRKPRLDERNLLTDDEKDFIETCEAGKLYDTFVTDNQTRDQVKKGLFAQTLYCNQMTMKHSKLGKEFSEKWPTVARTLSEFKGKDFEQVPRLMQRIESNFIFNRVIPRLATDHPDMFVTTIHDSIITTAEHSQTVIDIMLDEFAIMGLTPSIKTGN